MYKLKITRQAAKELECITDYISVHLDSPIVAVQFSIEVAAHYERLETTPHMYEFCRDTRLRALGYRRVVIRNYILVYRVDEVEEIVYILHFFHGSQSYEKLM